MLVVLVRCLLTNHVFICLPVLDTVYYSGHSDVQRLREQVRDLEDAKVRQAELRDKAETELKALQQTVSGLLLM